MRPSQAVSGLQTSQLRQRRMSLCDGTLGEMNEFNTLPEERRVWYRIL